jgi:hypothetical protein
MRLAPFTLLADLSQSPSTPVGQVSRDGQFRWDGTQWVPIPPGTREATAWTRPMQLATAAFFAVQALFALVTSVIYINRDSMLRVINAQGRSIPANANIDTVVGLALFFAFAAVIAIAGVELVAAVGSYFGWRWMFWAALVLFALGGLGALTNLGYFSRPATTPVPLWGVSISEALSIVSLGLFVWLLIGLIRFGPWAMKKPGT